MRRAATERPTLHCPWRHHRERRVDSLRPALWQAPRQVPRPSTRGPRPGAHRTTGLHPQCQATRLMSSSQNRKAGHREGQRRDRGSDAGSTATHKQLTTRCGDKRQISNPIEDSLVSRNQSGLCCSGQRGCFRLALHTGPTELQPLTGRLCPQAGPQTPAADQ